jgi:hypothetical protein
MFQTYQMSIFTEGSQNQHFKDFSLLPDDNPAEQNDELVFFLIVHVL